MEVYEYLENLKVKIRNFFIIHEGHLLHGNEVDIYAFCNINNQKYLGSKKLKIWNYEINEHCLINTINTPLDLKKMMEFTDWLKNLISELVIPHSEHMQTYLTGVIITTENIDRDLINYIESYKYSKSFKWGFQGWCDLRLIVVNITNHQVITNKKAEEVKQVYHPKLLA